MQDTFCASHTVLVDTWMLTSCDLFYDLKWNTNTRVTSIYNLFKASLTISTIFKTFLLPLIFYLSTHPVIFQPAHNGFYPSKWLVGGSLHKAMIAICLVIQFCYDLMFVILPSCWQCQLFPCSGMFYYTAICLITKNFHCVICFIVVLSPLHLCMLFII